MKAINKKSDNVIANNKVGVIVCLQYEYMLYNMIFRHKKTAIKRMIAAQRESMNDYNVSFHFLSRRFF